MGKYIDKLVLDLELSRVCNYNCKFCINNTLLKKGFMSPGLLDLVLKKLTLSSFYFIDVAGVGDLEMVPDSLLMAYKKVFLNYKILLQYKLLFNIKIGRIKYKVSSIFFSFFLDLYKAGLIKDISIGLFDYFFLEKQKNWSFDIFLYNFNLFYRFLGSDVLNIEMVITNKLNLTLFNKYKKLFMKLFPGVELYPHFLHNWCGRVESKYILKMDFRNDAGNLFFFPYCNFKGDISICSLQAGYSTSYITNIFELSNFGQLAEKVRSKAELLFKQCRLCNIRDYCFSYKYFIHDKHKKKTYN